MSDIPLKHCSKCKQVKPLTEFNFRSKSKGKYSSACRDCERKRHGYTKQEVYPPGMKRCAKCKELLSVERFYARSDQPGKFRAYCISCTEKRAAQYYIQYKDERSEHSRVYHQQLPQEVMEEVRARNKKWALEHPQEMLNYARKHRGNNREKINAGRRDYYQRNAMLERARQAQRRVVERNGDADYASIWERDKGICHLCQKKVSLKDLHFDHVFPVSRGGLHTMDNVKVSHAYCNKQKGPKLMEEYMEYLKAISS